MRGRNRNKGPNPLTRSYESNGPDVKIRGTAQHISEKYSQLARDALSSGDPVAAENYYQHAEHYYRIIAAAQEQFREQYGIQRSFDEDGEDDQPFGYGGPGERQNGEDGDFGNQPQPYEQRSEGGERPQRFDRGERQGGERFDRGERQDRGDRYDRGDRQDRGERQERGERQDRGDHRGDRRERFGRGDRPQRPDYAPRQDYQRQDYAPRQGGRDEFRGEAPPPPREPRRERAPEPEDAVNGLPAFLTAPLRAPVPVSEPEAPVEAAPVADTGDEASGGETAGRYRQRRRRSPRAASTEGAELPLAPDGSTSE